MYQPPNYIWRCECGEEISAHYDETTSATALPPKCPKCGKEMRGDFIIKGGPHHEHPWKQY